MRFVASKHPNTGCNKEAFTLVAWAILEDEDGLRRCLTRIHYGERSSQYFTGGLDFRQIWKKYKNSIRSTKMTINQDNGYISDYLIHWTGRDGDEHGAVALSAIASTRKLLLSYNRLHIFDIYHEIHEKMVCFTDVPIVHSAQHCKRYGRFGIAFHKLKLMNIGAQPVFYATHVCKRDMDVIFKFLQDQVKATTIDPTLFRALHRHFYFIQRFSDNRADRKDTFYYEREWRLGEQTLIPLEKLDRPNAKYRCQQEGYPPYTGRLARDGDNIYFDFDKEWVAFLIAPKDWQNKIKNPHGFPIRTYEEMVNDEKGNRS